MARFARVQASRAAIWSHKSIGVGGRSPVVVTGVIAMVVSRVVIFRRRGSL